MIFEKLSFSGSRPITKYDSVTIYDSLAYYTSRQPVITIYDRCVITIHDTSYHISRQVLQYKCNYNSQCVDSQDKNINVIEEEGKGIFILPIY